MENQDDFSHFDPEEQVRIEHLLAEMNDKGMKSKTLFLMAAAADLGALYPTGQPIGKGFRFQSLLARYEDNFAKSVAERFVEPVGLALHKRRAEQVYLLEDLPLSDEAKSQPAQLEKAQAHHDADDLTATVLERMRKFHEGVAEPTKPKPKPVVVATPEPIDDMGVYRRAREARLIQEAQEARLQEIWVFAAGGRPTEDQMRAVGRMIDVQRSAS